MRDWKGRVVCMHVTRMKQLEERQKENFAMQLMLQHNPRGGARKCMHVMEVLLRLYVGITAPTLSGYVLAYAAACRAGRHVNFCLGDQRGPDVHR